MHCQFHNQSLSLKACSYQFHYQFPRTCTFKFTVGPYFQGHALSISLSIPKDMHCQFHNQSLSLKACSYQFHYQFPRTCTFKFTVGPYFQGHALSISLSIPKDMHCQFHNQSLSPRACTVNFTINPISKGMHCQFQYQFSRTCTVNFRVPITKGLDYQFHYEFPKTSALNFTISPHCQGYTLPILLSVP